MENNDKEKSENENKILNNEDPMKYIDKVYKFITKEKREIIGNLKAFNREGNFYLIDCVEVFNKNSDNFYINDLFKNTEDHTFYYETDNFHYQYLNNCIFPSEEIGDILMLKEDIFNKYKELLNNFYKEKIQKETANENENESKDNDEKEEKKEMDNKDDTEEIMDDIKKEAKRKKRRKKKK